MNKSITLLAAAALLTGCSSSAALQRQMLAGDKPIAEFTSSKSQAAISSCIEDGMRPLVGVGQKLSVTDEGQTRILWVTNLGNPFATARVTPTEGGSVVDYRVRFRGSAQPFTNAVMACR